MEVDGLKSRLKKLDNDLVKLYGEPSRERIGKSSPLDELILTILSQNTNDRNSSRGFYNLKKSFPNWENVLQANEEEIAEAIKVSGLSTVKAARIKNILKQIFEERGALNLDFLNDLSENEGINYLMKFKGVGRKTATCVLAFALGKDVFPVDTHILRIAKRLALIPAKADAETAHQLLGDNSPQGRKYSLHLNLITHGRVICKAKNPDCHKCPLKLECAYYREKVKSQTNRRANR